LEELQYRFDPGLKEAEFDLFNGDLIEGGRGEILMRV
jgi:hypothetical protein